MNPKRKRGKRSGMPSSASEMKACSTVADGKNRHWGEPLTTFDSALVTNGKKVVLMVTATG